MEPNTPKSGSNVTIEYLKPYAEEDKIKMAAMFGNRKNNHAKHITDEKEQNRTISEHSPVSCLYFQKCQDSQYTIEGRCAKILIDGCKNCKFLINGKIVTGTFDIWRCNDVDLKINVDIGTLQVDICNNLSITFNEKETVQSIVWTNSYNLNLDFNNGHDHKLVTGMDQKMEELPNITDKDQFIVRFVKEKLLSEQIIRLKNGFPSTQRETVEFERKQEENLRKLYARGNKKMGG